MAAPPKGLTAVLFDMDGTLIDSEKLWTLALLEVAEELGGALSPETRAAMVGTDLVNSVHLLMTDLGISGDPAVVQRLLVAATARQFDRDMEWRPGAQQLLAAVREADLRTALVTSTHRNLTSVALETIGRDNFDIIVCGDDVAHTKPNPEPYLRALHDLGVDRSVSVAIEDSPAGSTSAAAAGLATLVVPLEVPVDPAPLLTIRHSLVGVTVADLRGLLAA